MFTMGLQNYFVEATDASEAPGEEK